MYVIKLEEPFSLEAIKFSETKEVLFIALVVAPDYVLSYGDDVLPKAFVLRVAESASPYVPFYKQLNRFLSEFTITSSPTMEVVKPSSPSDVCIDEIHIIQYAHNPNHNPKVLGMPNRGMYEPSYVARPPDTLHQDGHSHIPSLDGLPVYSIQPV